MNFTDEAKEAARYLVEQWDKKIIPQKFVLSPLIGGKFLISSRNRSDFTNFEIPELNLLEELGFTGLISVNQNYKGNYEVLLLQSLRDAVNNNFGLSTTPVPIKPSGKTPLEMIGDLINQLENIPSSNEGELKRIYETTKMISERILGAEHPLTVESGGIHWIDNPDRRKQELKTTLHKLEVAFRLPIQKLIDNNSVFGEPFTSSQFQCDVFMVMPFRPHLNSIYDDHIKKSVYEIGLDIKRGDDPYTKHDIIKEIWSLIMNCQLVIADCTEPNLNVLYEIGLSHARDKPVIIITQDENNVPFDLRHRRYIKYENTEQGLLELEAQLKRAIQSILGE